MKKFEDRYKHLTDSARRLTLVFHLIPYAKSGRGVSDVKTLLVSALGL